MASYMQRLRMESGLASLVRESGRHRPQKIVVDYARIPAPQAFQLGHLRTALLARFIEKTNKMLGHDVISIGNLGDWGLQFPLITCYWPQERPSEQFWQSRTSRQKLQSLYDCYIVAKKRAETDQDFSFLVRMTTATMEKDVISNNVSSKSLELWNEIRALSRTCYTDVYKLFDIEIDRWKNDSDYVPQCYDEIAKMVMDGIARQTENGDIVVSDEETDEKYVLTNEQILQPLARDITKIITRDERLTADRYIFVTDKKYKKNFIALKYILTRMGLGRLAEKVEHIGHCSVRGLNTRHGRIAAVETIVDHGDILARDFIKRIPMHIDPSNHIDQVARNMCTAAISFNVIKRARNSEYEMAFQNAFSYDMENAFALQTKLQRLNTIESRHPNLLPLLDSCNIIPEDSSEVLELVRILYNFDAIIARSALLMEPCILTGELLKLGKLVGEVANQLQLKNHTHSIAVPRLLLLSASRHVLSEGMKLLGVNPLYSHDDYKDFD